MACFAGFHAAFKEGVPLCGCVENVLPLFLLWLCKDTFDDAWHCFDHVAKRGDSQCKKTVHKDNSTYIPACSLFNSWQASKTRTRFRTSGVVSKMPEPVDGHQDLPLFEAVFWVTC
jgi:hypothetical protein